VPHLYEHGHAESAEGVVEYVVMSRMPGDALVRRLPDTFAEGGVVQPVADVLVGDGPTGQVEGADGDALGWAFGEVGADQHRRRGHR